MRACVVGSGGREHALAHVLGRTADVVVTPGNPGIPGSVTVPPTELDADLFVVGPEGPLVDGLADQLRGQGKRVFGPGADGARLEGSKAWMKEVLGEAGVATADHATFTALEPAVAYLDSMSGTYVIKTDGLAAGKGVLVTESLEEARHAVGSYLSGEAFGDAGRRVVIEQGLVGPELSMVAICDGTRAVPMAPAQDFKRVGDGDTGPNTGGMGAYSPVPLAGPDVVERVMDEAVEPTLRVLQRRGIDFRGVLYAGLMLTADGPALLEFNVRFGDPEAQVVLPRLESDLTDLLARAADGALTSAPSFAPDGAVTVACASEGYPRSSRTGDVIEGLGEMAGLDGVTVYSAGVGRDDDGRYVTAGGRVLTVTGMAPSLGEARRLAYDGMGRISFPGMQYRHDIAEAAEGVEHAHQGAAR